MKNPIVNINKLFTTLEHNRKTFRRKLEKKYLFKIRTHIPANFLTYDCHPRASDGYYKMES